MTQLSIYKVQPKEDVIRLELELTSFCNLKCPLCIREFMDLPKNEYRPLAEIIAQLDSYPNLEYVTIAGAVAEPTTYPDLIPLLIYLRKRNIEICLFINGDTKTDEYYRKLGVVFHACRGNIYFSMFGSTQELHERYRVNSNLERVLRRLDIVNRYSNNKGILTWVVFNYNEQDFEENYQQYKDKYRTEFIYTLPVAEHFEIESTIRLPDKMHQAYMEQIDRTDFSNIICPANNYNFVQITYDGTVVPCSLYRLHGEKHCFECSTKNKTMLRANCIKNVAEAESDSSEAPLRLYYDR